MSSEYVRPLRPLKPDQITTHWLDGQDGSPGCWSQHTGCVDVYVARLRAALPDAAKLWALAEWFDAKYPDDEQPEVQADLRAWARAAFASDRSRYVGATTVDVLASDATPLPGEGM